MMKSFLCVSLVAALLATASIIPCRAAALAQPAAMQKAVAILKGDPYSKTPDQVRRHIVGSAYLFPGSRAAAACGPMRKPVWVFDVAVPAKPGATGHEAINGALVLDAATGKMECATLPFLD